MQCDCARQSDASLLQVLSVANHPRVWQKIAHPAGKVDAIIKQTEQPRERIEASNLNTVSRLAHGLGNGNLLAARGTIRVAGEGIAKRAVGIVEYERVFVAALTFLSI